MHVSAKNLRSLNSINFVDLDETNKLVVAKIGVDRVKNEPSTVWMRRQRSLQADAARPPRGRRSVSPPARRRPVSRRLGDVWRLHAEVNRTLA